MTMTALGSTRLKGARPIWGQVPNHQVADVKWYYGCFKDSKMDKIDKNTTNVSF